MGSGLRRRERYVLFSIHEMKGGVWLLWIVLIAMQLVYLDFKPKVWKTGNDTVEYKVTTCK